MKRFLTLLTLLASFAGMWAQDSHFELSFDPSQQGSYGSTVVYAKLDLANQQSEDYATYEVAAFVGDECRAVARCAANPALATYVDKNYFVLNVAGNFGDSDSDTGKPITFKVFDEVSNAVIELTPSQTITFANEGKYGEPSNLVVLSGTEWAIEPEGDVLYCNVGDDIIERIKDYYTILPEDVEQTPPAVVYSIGPNADASVLSISQTSIKALKSGSTYVSVTLDGVGVSCVVEVNVQNWAKAGQANPSTLEVTYYDSEFDIFDQVKQLVTFTPEGYEDLNIEVTSDNPDVVEPSVEFMRGELVGSILVNGTGTATLTFTVSYPDYASDPTGETLKESTFTLTVNVKQGLLRLDIFEKLITVNKGETFDLTTIINPYPEDAEIDYSKLSYEIARAYAGSIAVENNILTGLEVVERAELAIRYADLPNYYYSLLVDVINPAKALVVNTPEITVNKGDSETLTAALAAAVTMDPADATDQIVWKSADETIVAPLTDADGWNPLAGGDVTMTAQVFDNNSSSNLPRLEATVTVHVVVPVTSITINTANITWLNVGDDPTDYLKSVVTILPEDATNKSYHFEVANNFTLSDGRVLAQSAGIGRVKAVADDGSGVESAYKNFSIFIQANDVSFGGDIVTTYDGTQVDISEQVKDNITFVPENASFVTATTTSSNPDVATVNVTIRRTATNTPVDVTVNAKALSVGRSTITMAITYTDFLANLIDPRQDHSTTVERSFTIIVNEGLKGFTTDYPTDMAIGQTYQIVLTPQPADADVDLNAFRASGTANNLPETWPYMTFDKPVKQADGTIVINVYPQEPDGGSLLLTYSDESNYLNVIDSDVNVGVALTLDEGWQWRTLWSDVSNREFTDYFGTDGILEVRSQDELMARDSEIGYFGDLYDNGLKGMVAYKIKATRDRGIDDAKIQFSGFYQPDAMPQNLLRGWTWIPYPYYHFMTFDQLGIQGAAGDKIVSKDGGFVEYDGTSWTGTLKGMQPWQSYLYYNSTDAVSSFDWQSEVNVYTPDDQVQPGGNARRKVSPRSAWQYDPRPYRDNMSIVAVVNEQCTMNNEQWSIGAFVDGECRGEGQCVDGRMFITVHANNGEQVSFRLRNELTGELFDIDQTVPFGAMLGSLKAPVQLTSQAVVTGVNNVQCTMNNVQEAFDLGGRAVKATTAKGLTIRRQADGTVRKVVK